MPAPTVRQPTATEGGDSKGSAGGTLHLTVMAPNVFETHPLPSGGAIRIGRDDSVQVRVIDELASRQHACLYIDASGPLSIEDLKSENGTFVRGERIEPGKRVAIHPGEGITIGLTHLMVQRRRPTVPTRLFHSHGAFEERLEDACARASGTGSKLAVVRVRFENENSPGSGATTVSAALRTGDFLAQYAAGDYEALLIDTEPERARQIAEDAAFRARAEGLAVRMAIATYPADGRSAEALIGRANAMLRGPDSDSGRGGPVLKSESMRKLYHMAERAAAGHTATGLINVLVLGETGVGKEVLADWLHNHSPRANGPLVSINCAALTESLLESELFGYERGAFTGATQAKPGLLEAAAKGTVFLDEVGDMTTPLQTKLLRAIESRQVTRVGSVSPRPIDVRFVAATNRDLEADIVSNRFRQDLYFRLNGFSLTIPPLRDRPDEIEPLARRFLTDAAAAARQLAPSLSVEALQILQTYWWPGNIRELRNVIERALVLCDSGQILPEHLPVEKMRLARPPSPAAAASAAAAAVDDGADNFSPDERDERRRILDTLAECGGNQTRTARKLGIARGTLIERLKRYGVKRPQAQVDDE